jgi:hypothetical protein
MKTPKFDIGDRFFVSYTLLNAEVVFDNTERDTVGTFTHIPTVAVITKISIDRKQIVYTTMEYSKGDNKIIKRSIDRTEKELQTLHHSLTKLLKSLLFLYTDSFQKVVKEVNKEKLSDVLNGGK